VKRFNLGQSFFDSLFLKKKLEKLEFFTKIKENCDHSIDMNTINSLYEDYEKILSKHKDFKISFEN